MNWWQFIILCGVILLSAGMIATAIQDMGHNIQSSLAGIIGVLSEEEE